jgi:RES domain-containing protein
MADYFRIVSKTNSDKPFGYGKGAARWNPKNVPIIYAASSTSLAMTEFLCIKGSVVLKTEWSLITYAIATEPPLLEPDTLPSDWDARPHSMSTQQFGEEWIKSLTSLCLKVPSARLPLGAYPTEHNLLINPVHPNLLKEVKVKSISSLHFNLNEWATGGDR